MFKMALGERVTADTAAAVAARAERTTPPTTITAMESILPLETKTEITAEETAAIMIDAMTTISPGLAAVKAKVHRGVNDVDVDLERRKAVVVGDDLLDAGGEKKKQMERKGDTVDRPEID